ncbi:MAG: hypothetical protein KKB51_07245 [Candidatus Riflebacteria bacterium]|nr:hypothetical protein [Candidatus Riflebacteria bacterium]
MKQAAILLMILMFTTVAFAEPGNYIDEMGAIVEEISLLNLLRGLYLNEEQAKKIAELAIEAESIRETAKEEIAQLNAMTVLAQLRDELYTALAENPPAVRTSVVKLDNQAHKIVGAVLDRIARLEDEVRTSLTHGQQKIVWEFIPCIVPEVDFENPVRTGQAAASSRLLPALKLIRETPEDMWKKHGQNYLDYILKVTEQEAGIMTDDTREDLRRRLVKHAWKIRKMKEPDFMINRDSLAKDLLLVNRERTFRSGYRTTGKISRFLLSPAATKVLPRWVETHFGKESVGANAVEASSTSLITQPAVVVPVVPDPNQSSLPAGDADALFWSELVPKSLARLAETPYYNQVYDAFGRPLSQYFFGEEDKYVDLTSLIVNAGVILEGSRPGYYTLTPGEP